MPTYLRQNLLVSFCYVLRKADSIKTFPRQLKLLLQIFLWSTHVFSPNFNTIS